MTEMFECGERVKGPDCEGKVICVGGNVAAVEWGFCKAVELNLKRFDIVSRFVDGGDLIVLGVGSNRFAAGMPYVRHLDEQNVDVTGKIVCAASNYALVKWDFFETERYNLRMMDIIFDTKCIGVVIL